MKLKFRINNIFKDKNKNITVIYIIIIIGVLLLCMGSLIPHKTTKTAEDRVINENLEERLANILSEISGVGDVNVMITYKSSAMKAAAKNKTLETGDGNSKLNEETVILGSGGGAAPFIIREDMPKIQGVVVVARGAENAGIRKEISDAVKALTGVSAANIGVFPK